MNPTIVAPQRQPELTLGTPIRFRNVGMIPIIPHTGSNLTAERYLTAQRALRDGVLKVTETGTVNKLGVHSLATLPIFVPAGLLLTGGGQNRIAITSLIIAPGAQGELPTRCVEEHRWNPLQGQSFRSEKDSSMSASSMPIGSTQISQDETWADVQHLIDATKSEAPTANLGAAYTKTAPDRADYSQVLKLPSDQAAIGIVFVIYQPRQQKEFSWLLHLFGRQELLGDLFADICNSVTLDAVAAGWQGPSDDVPPDRLLEGASEILQAIYTTSCQPEHIPLNRGRLTTGTSSGGDRIAKLEDKDALVHVLSQR